MCFGSPSAVRPPGPKPLNVLVNPYAEASSRGFSMRGTSGAGGSGVQSLENLAFALGFNDNLGVSGGTAGKDARGFNTGVPSGRTSLYSFRNNPDRNPRDGGYGSDPYLAPLDTYFQGDLGRDEDEESPTYGDVIYPDYSDPDVLQKQLETNPMLNAGELRNRTLYDFFRSENWPGEISVNDMSLTERGYLGIFDRIGWDSTKWIENDAAHWEDPNWTLPEDQVPGHPSGSLPTDTAANGSMVNQIIDSYNSANTFREAGGESFDLRWLNTAYEGYKNPVEMEIWRRNIAAYDEDGGQFPEGFDVNAPLDPVTLKRVLDLNPDFDYPAWLESQSDPMDQGSSQPAPTQEDIPNSTAPPSPNSGSDGGQFDWSTLPSDHPWAAQPNQPYTDTPAPSEWSGITDVFNPTGLELVDNFDSGILAPDSGLSAPTPQVGLNTTGGATPVPTAPQQTAPPPQTSTQNIPVNNTLNNSGLTLDQENLARSFLPVGGFGGF